MGKNSLKKGKSKEAILKNIEIMESRGRTRNQAILTALAVAGIIYSKKDPRIREGFDIDSFKRQ
jgi:hypothetical protein